MSLPLYSEPAYYRMLFRERTHDIPFYSEATQAAEEVLELGVGTGRVAFALAALGKRVTGVDRAQTMLEELELRRQESPEAARGRVDTVCSDLRALRLDRRFGAVICPFNGFAHFATPDEQHAFFETVRHHLAGRGRLAFDVLIPDPALLAGGASNVPRLEHPRTGAICRMEERYEYDPLSQRLTVTTELVERETSERQTLTLVLRQLFPQETLLLLEHHGFRVLERRELGDALGYVVELA